MLKLNHTNNVNMYFWFTNLPRYQKEEDNNIPLADRAPGGVTDVGCICTAKRTTLIRGPDRNDLETAGVGNTQIIL